VTVAIADITAEMENDRRESVMKLIQAYDVLAKTVHATLHKDLQLSKSWPGEQSNFFMWRQRRSYPKTCQAVTALITAAF
jgi:hypothetical protein